MSARGDRPTLAVFDFDRTITTRDTSLPFLAFAVGRARLAAALVTRAPWFLADLGVELGRGFGAARDRWEVEVHERLVRALLGGRTLQEVRELGRRFAEAPLDAMVAPDALRQVAWHREQGHQCVLATASLDVYMEPWGRRAGFHRVLASRVAHDGTTVRGGFDGGACWGDAKVERLRAAIGALERFTLVVYGNEPGDGPLLARADHPIRVRPGDLWPRLAADVRAALHVA